MKRKYNNGDIFTDSYHLSHKHGKKYIVISTHRQGATAMTCYNVMYLSDFEMHIYPEDVIDCDTLVAYGE